MKKTVLIFTVLVALIAIYSFAANDEYLESNPKETVTSNEVEYIKNIVNNELNVHLQTNFVRFFDEVNYVEALFSKDVGYHYAVYGKKDGSLNVQFLKIEKDDIENETYTYFDFEGITVTELTKYCYRGGGCVGCQLLDPSFDCRYICGPWPWACD